MKPWKRAAVLSLFVSSMAMADEHIALTPVYPSDASWRFQQVKTYQQDNHTYLSGRIAIPPGQRISPGHVDITAFSPGGERIWQTTAPIQPPLLTHRKRIHGGLKFSSELPSGAMNPNNIRVSYHPDGYHKPSLPLHGKTGPQ